MLGGKLGTALAKEYEVSTVAELLSISLDEMQHKFGEESIWVYEVIRGIDRSEVKEKPVMTKSMAASKNLPKPIMKPSQGKGWLRMLAAELSLRLKDAREISPNLWPKSIVLGVQQGYSSSHSKQAPFPFVRNVTTDVVVAAGDKLWKEFFGTSDSVNVDLNVNHISLAFGGIESGEANQQGIEGFLAKASETGKPHSRNQKRKLGDDNHLEDAHPSTSKDHTTRDFFTCERCGQLIKLSATLPDVDDDRKRESLAALRTEHSDFHFAQDLSKVRDKEQSVSLIKKSGKAKKKKTSEPEGIAKFFTKQ